MIMDIIVHTVLFMLNIQNGGVRITGRLGSMRHHSRPGRIFPRLFPRKNLAIVHYAPRGELS